MLKIALGDERLFHRLASHPLLGRFVVFRIDRLPAVRDGGLAAGLFQRIYTREGVTKQTGAGRLSELDRMVPDFLAEGVNAIHDVGVSSGVTSLELHAYLRERGVAFKLHVSDKYSRCFGRGKQVRTIYDFDKRPLCGYVFGILADKRCTWKFPVSKALSLLVGKNAKASDPLDEIVLYDPRLVDLIRRGEVHEEIAYDVFSTPLVERFTFVRCMNLLNPTYFTPEEIQRALATLTQSLKEQGVLLLGRTLPDGRNEASFYRRIRGELVLERHVNGGCEIAHVIAPAARGVDRVDPRSVLLVCPQFHPMIGGYEKGAERLASALVEAGMRVTVVAERRSRKWASREERDGYEVRRLPCLVVRHLHALTGSLSLAVYLLLHGREFEVWHVCQPGVHSGVAIGLARLLGCRVVFNVTSTGDNGIAAAMGHGLPASFIASLHRRADACVVLNEEMRQEALRFGLLAERIHVLPVPVDGKRFRPPTAVERTAAREALGFRGERIALFVGRFSPEKNLLGLLEAWQSLDDATRGTSRLVLLGDGPQRAEVVAKMRVPELAASVVLAGHQDDPAPYYRAADLLVIPSRREGLSAAMREALASGLPVISTRVAGSSLLLGNPPSGVVVDVGDTAALAKAIQTLLNDDATRTGLARAARPTFDALDRLEELGARVGRLYSTVGNHFHAVA